MSNNQLQFIMIMIQSENLLRTLLLNNKIILELKSVRRVISKYEQQLVNYLTATRIDVGLIINFGETKVEIKRKVRELPEA